MGLNVRLAGLGATLAAGLLAPVFAPAQAQLLERRVPNAAELRLSYAPVVQRVAPAVVNAIYAATGKRLRRLPIDTAALKRV